MSLHCERLTMGSDPFVNIEERRVGGASRRRGTMSGHADLDRKSQATLRVAASCSPAHNIEGDK